MKPYRVPLLLSEPDRDNFAIGFSGKFHNVQTGHPMSPAQKLNALGINTPLGAKTYSDIFFFEK